MMLCNVLLAKILTFSKATPAEIASGATRASARAFSVCGWRVSIREGIRWRDDGRDSGIP